VATPAHTGGRPRLVANPVMNRPVDARPPLMLGRYELVAPIAAGAIGELWRARIASGPEEGRVVALRRIPRTEKLDASAVERITNAGFSAMELRHPKIAAVLDVFVAESEVGIVSEHIAGSVVQALVRPQGKRVTVPIPAALRIAVDVLEAVDALRGPWAELVPEPETDDERRLAAGVHGGLVPDDLWIASFGETMLLEVGLAGVALGLPAILEHPDVIAYRAPEQLEGQAPIDERADVFTVGILLWELIAGRSLFGSTLLPRPGAAPGPAAKTKGIDALQVSAAKRKVVSAPAQRLDTMPLLKGKVTKALADVVARCLEKAPGARFQSVREAIDAIVALGPGNVGNADAVAKIVAAIVVEAPRDDEARPELSSNRPTVPPEDAMHHTAPPETRKVGAAAAGAQPLPDDVTRPRMRVDAEPVAPEPVAVTPAPTPVEAVAVGATAPTSSVAFAESVPPSTDVESLPPSHPMTESVPATRIDSEAPSSRSVASEVTTIPPDSSELLTIPPSADIESLPPSSAAPVAPDVVESAAPPSDGSTMASAVSMGIDEASLPPLVQESARPESVEIVSSFGVHAEPYRGSLAVTDEPSVPVDAADDVQAAAEERRAKSKKIVVIVMAVAGLLALLGVLRALLTSHEGPTTASSAAASAAAEPAPAVPGQAPSPAAEDVAPEPVGQGATSPTPAPASAASAGASGAAEGSTKKTAKKKPFRPTGI
jgi:eukaryotic-like serine/threonine-protein kinase